ncbi:hypothetical protein LTR35_014056, partial [Friedmanniomyces endolithicus]
MPGLTIIADDEGPELLYIKRPKHPCLDDAEETQMITRLLLEEARILESLKPNTHPNVVRCHGCMSKQGRIVGIALEKHDIILQYRFEDDPRELDVTTCIDGIRAGIAHLHFLEYAHNHLNPMNIALDETDQPVILDFGSCRKFGGTLLSGGTPGWTDEDYSISSPLHDEVALGKIKVVVTAAKIRMAGGGKCGFGRVFVVVRVNSRGSPDGDGIESRRGKCISTFENTISLPTTASSHLGSATHVTPASPGQRLCDPWR